MRFIDNVSSLFSSINSSNKNKRKKKTAATPSKSISKYDDNPSSFGSSTTSLSSASDFSSSSSSTSTPKSVLPLSVSDVFNLFDRDRDGKITRFELQTVLRQLGHDPPLTDMELDSMVQEIDRDGDGCISLEELAVVDQEISGLGGWSSNSSSSVEEEMRDAFRVFDADGDGKISAEELMGVFVALGEEDCGIDECRRMIAGVDSDGDGFVCFQDFLKMMMVEGQQR